MCPCHISFHNLPTGEGGGGLLAASYRVICRRPRNSILGQKSMFFLLSTVTHLEDVGALVDDNLFERDILIATKKLACLLNISERTQGI